MLEWYHRTLPYRVLVHFLWDPSAQRVVGTGKMDPKSIILNGFHFQPDATKPATDRRYAALLSTESDGGEE